METLVDFQELETEENCDSPADRCPVVWALQVIGGKWKPAILWEIRRGLTRFGKLQRALPDCSRKMLTQQLRELERDGIIWRKVYAQVPPRVEYGFTAHGETLNALLDQIAAWGEFHRKSLGSSTETNRESLQSASHRRAKTRPHGNG